jgi:hypothetical protein
MLTHDLQREELMKREPVIECAEESIGVHEIDWDWDEGTRVFADKKIVKVWRVK